MFVLLLFIRTKIFIHLTLNCFLFYRAWSICISTTTHCILISRIWTLEGVEQILSFSSFSFLFPHRIHHITLPLLKILNILTSNLSNWKLQTTLTKNLRRMKIHQTKVESSSWIIVTDLNWRSYKALRESFCFTIVLISCCYNT